jgi:Ni/Co efflux regulator RcnB
MPIFSPRRSTPHIYKDLPQRSSTGKSSTRSSAVETKGNRMTNRQKEPDRTKQIETKRTITQSAMNLSSPDIPLPGPASSPSFHRKTVRCSSRRIYHSQYSSWHRGQRIPVPSVGHLSTRTSGRLDAQHPTGSIILQSLSPLTQATRIVDIHRVPNSPASPALSLPGTGLF